MRPPARARRFLSALLFAGCAASPAQRPDVPLIAQPPPAPAAPQVAPVASDAVPTPPVPLPTGPVGAIPRSELDRVLAGSPGAFLAHVDAEPVLEGKRFVGWRIASLFRGDPRFAGCALRPGDVVLRVNDRPIERPEQFSDAWEALRTANSLWIAVLRDGRQGTLSWSIAPAAR